MAFILTRVTTDDYEAWKPMFDADSPGARSTAREHRLFRNVDNPNEVFIQIEFGSTEEAQEARAKLLAAHVLDRFPDHSGPTVVEVAETVHH